MIHFSNIVSPKRKSLSSGLSNKFKFSELFYQPVQAHNPALKALFTLRECKHVVFNRFIFPITAICGQS